MKVGDLMTGNAVKGMSIPETIGAGLIGGLADSALYMTVGGRLPTVANAGIEIAAGLIGGGLIKGTFGNMLQNGMIISGCNKLVNLGTALVMGAIAGQKNTETAAANSGNRDATLY